MESIAFIPFRISNAESKQSEINLNFSAPARCDLRRNDQGGAISNLGTPAFGPKGPWFRAVWRKGEMQRPSSTACLGCLPNQGGIRCGKCYRFVERCMNSRRHTRHARACKQEETYTHFGRWHHRCLLPPFRTKIWTKHPRQLSLPPPHVRKSLLAAVIGPPASHH